jgi:hypothetical protein
VVVFFAAGFVDVFVVDDEDVALFFAAAGARGLLTFVDVDVSFVVVLDLVALVARDCSQFE